MLVAAGRDVLRVVSAQEGTDYAEDVAPLVEDAGDLSQLLGDVWTDGLPAYEGMDHNHQTVIHDEGYLSEEGNTHEPGRASLVVVTAVAGEIPRSLQVGLEAGCSNLWLSPVTEPRPRTDPWLHRLHRHQCVPLDYRTVLLRFNLNE